MKGKRENIKLSHTDIIEETVKRKKKTIAKRMKNSWDGIMMKNVQKLIASLTLGFMVVTGD
jgi:hypothetical protein